MKTTFIFIVLLLILNSGCNRIQEQNSEPAAPAEQQKATYHQQENWEENIRLDEGRKWKISRRTTEGINTMSGVLQQDSANSVEEYRELGRRLQEERTGVEDGRTGSDPSDDNLNIYLNPLDQKIRQLQEVQSVEEGARLKSEIEKHLYAYSNYFV